MILIRKLQFCHDSYFVSKDNNMKSIKKSIRLQYQIGKAWLGRPDRQPYLEWINMAKLKWPKEKAKWMKKKQEIFPILGYVFVLKYKVF